MPQAAFLLLQGVEEGKGHKNNTTKEAIKTSTIRVPDVYSVCQMIRLE